MIQICHLRGASSKTVSECKRIRKSWGEKNRPVIIRCQLFVISITIPVFVALNVVHNLQVGGNGLHWDCCRDDKELFYFKSIYKAFEAMANDGPTRLPFVLFICSMLWRIPDQDIWVKVLETLWLPNVYIVCIIFSVWHQTQSAAIKKKKKNFCGILQWWSQNLFLVVFSYISARCFRVTYGTESFQLTVVRRLIVNGNWFTSKSDGCGHYLLESRHALSTSLPINLLWYCHCNRKPRIGSVRIMNSFLNSIIYDITRTIPSSMWDWCRSRTFL